MSVKLFSANNIMTPTLSIVIANYNFGRFLENAIQSVLTQEVGDQIELIICDGGSTDNSVEIIAKYSDQISWWCSEKDKGQSDAFNKGFSHARGRFGCWLNADDMFMPGALRAVIEYIAHHPHAEWIGASSVFANGNLEVMWCSRCVRTVMLGCRYVPYYAVNGPSSFFLLENLRKVGGFDLKLRYTMDTDLWRKFIRAGIKLYHVKNYVWCFRIHEASKTSHRFTTGRSEDAFSAECRECNDRYGISDFRNRIGSTINRVLRFISGTYLWSYMDTLRAKGKPIDALSRG